jgi:hypothetical protein
MPPAVLPLNKRVGTEACIANGELVADQLPVADRDDGFPKACFVPDVPLDPDWNHIASIWRCPIQKFYAQLLELLYDEMAGPALFAARQFFGPDATIRYHDGSATLPTMMTVLHPDYIVCIATGTQNYQQLALQAFYSIQGPQNFGAFSTNPQWYAAGQFLHTVLLADGATDARPILFAGHSYGAAAVLNLAARYRFANLVRRIRYITYGSPKPGDSRMIDLLRLCQGVDFTNAGDFVTVLPPSPILLNPVYAALLLPQLLFWTEWEFPPNLMLAHADGSTQINEPPTLDSITLMSYTLRALANLQLADIFTHHITVYIERIALRCPGGEMPASGAIGLGLERVGGGRLGLGGAQVAAAGQLGLRGIVWIYAGQLGLGGAQVAAGQLGLGAQVAAGQLGLVSPGDAAAGQLGLVSPGDAAAGQLGLGGAQVAAGQLGLGIVVQVASGEIGFAFEGIAGQLGLQAGDVVAGRLGLGGAQVAAGQLGLVSPGDAAAGQLGLVSPGDAAAGRLDLGAIDAAQGALVITFNGIGGRLGLGSSIQVAAGQLGLGGAQVAAGQLGLGWSGIQGYLGLGSAAQIAAGQLGLGAQVDMSAGGLGLKANKPEMAVGGLAFFRPLFNRIHDDFNVSNQTNQGRTPTIIDVPGTTWQNVLGTAGVVSNQLTGTTWSGGAVWTMIDNLQRANSITFNFQLPNTSSRNICIVIFRYLNTSNFWYSQAEYTIGNPFGTNNTLYLYEVLAGVGTQKATSSQTINPNTLYTFSVTDDGTAISCNIGGAAVGFSSTSQNTQGKVGIYMESGNLGVGGAPVVDDFIVN